MRRCWGWAAALLTLLCGCDDKASPPAPTPTTRASAPAATAPKRFRKLEPERSGIRFGNFVPEGKTFNIVTYQYFYNGGGVAAGDVNNDGLADLYFIANDGKNRLYLNEGGLHFEDVTDAAHVDGGKGWSTGVTMVDINHDGWLDLYVSRSGRTPPETRTNQLFVNNRDGTFSEKAAEYGLADGGFGTNASFFDYDGDGDLDAYVLNHNIFKKITPEVEANTYIRDKLYKNDDDHFVDVSEEAGIAQGAFDYGLSAAVGDLNDDGLPDVYVGTDFAGPDHLYLNQGDGTFRDTMKTAMGHTAYFCMGSDLADVNGDGTLDLFVPDMAPEDHYRQKTMMRSMNIQRFRTNVKAGFHYQYMYNVLQLNNGDGSFSEVAHMAGVAKSDWSWASLFADFDDDGDPDLFVTNGRHKNLLDVDFGKKMEQYLRDAGGRRDRVQAAIDRILKEAPKKLLSNYMFENRGELVFSNVASAWGVDEPASSSGTAYADLDNDGDLDLVVNNIDKQAYIYENQAQPGERWLRVQLKGPEKNPFAIGARLWLTTPSGRQLREQQLTRGFQSSVDPVVHFGMGKAERGSLEVRWPDGKRSTLEVTASKLVKVAYADATAAPKPPAAVGTPFEDYAAKAGVDAVQVENDYDDFERELLLPHRLSRLGPALASADVDGDGLDDFYVGGARGEAGTLYLQHAGGRFSAAPAGPWKLHAASEDVAAQWFDADGDGDRDLYVASGGNETEPGDPSLQDRLYLGDGKGGFEDASARLPTMHTSSGCAAPGDFDGDGDVDLFICGRLQPGAYPRPGTSHLLRNDGERFSDVTKQVAPELDQPGMVTAALWSDADRDGKLDLLLAGEWMPLWYLHNDGKHLRRADPKQSGLANTEGWWFALAEGDFDGDGDADYIAGNVGLNYKHHASVERPFSVYSHDFDHNGKLDIVLSYQANGQAWPARGRECSSQQMPFIAAKFPTYDSFGKATLHDVYGSDLEKAVAYHAKTFASSYVENLGGGHFAVRPLPRMAQLAPGNGIVVHDFDGDGDADVVMAGNLYSAEVETPRVDAGIGVYLESDGKGGLVPIARKQSGLSIDGDVRGLTLLGLGSKGRPLLIGARNLGTLAFVRGPADGAALSRE